MLRFTLRANVLVNPVKPLMLAAAIAPSLLPAALLCNCLNKNKKHSAAARHSDMNGPMLEVWIFLRMIVIIKS